MPILFLHIPKAAGTYVDSCVKQAKLDSVHAVSSPDEIKKAIQNKKRYIAGHFTFDSLCSASIAYTNYKLVTAVRNPIDRFISDINYHVEIIKRGKGFIEKHSDNWQRLILHTYRSLQESQSVGFADLSHLSGIMLQDYLASRLLTRNEIKEARQMTVSEAVIQLKSLLTRFDLIGLVENRGADLLLELIAKELSIDVSGFTPNPNASINYVPYEVLLPCIIAGLENSEVSNLLYLILTERLPEDLDRQSWEGINSLALDVCLSESRYKAKEAMPLPLFDLSHLEASVASRR